MKNVLITGGSRGIGKALVYAFVKKGYNVAFTYNKSEEEAQKISRELSALAIKADSKNENEVVFAVEEVRRKLGGIDILVNNAGISSFSLFTDITLSEWNDTFAVNVGGAFLCSREATKLMVSQGNGLIVNISSIWGEVGGSCESVYSASKGALISFTKALAKELGFSGVRVNCISPGMIETRMNDCFSAEEKRAIAEEIPLGRMGKAEEVASAVLFLEENEYVTGVDLAVGGGFGF